MDLHKTINQLKVLASWANEEKQLVELNDDEVKTLNNALKLLTEQAERIERYEKGFQQIQSEVNKIAFNIVYKPEKEE